MEEWHKKELQFKSEIQDILNEVGNSIPYGNAADIYQELVKTSMKIYGDEHDAHWQVRNRDIINTYL